jgi:UrcA family protein
MNRIIPVAVAAALAFTAGAVHAQDTNAPTARASYADLDLSNASGRATLGVRVAQAVNQVCGERPAPFELERMAAYDHCRAAARASADQQMAELYRGERLAQVAIQVSPSRR